MYRKLIENYQSPDYITLLQQMKSPKLNGIKLYEKAFVYHKTPDIINMEEDVRKLIDNNNTEEAIVLGLELDEYLTVIELPCKFLYHSPLIKKIHQEHLMSLDFHQKIDAQFEYLYSKSEYNFDKETEDMITKRLDNYIFNTNLESYSNQICEIMKHIPVFAKFNFKQLKVYLKDFVKMQEIIKIADKENITSHIQSLDKKSKISFIDNLFYDANASVMNDTIEYIVNELPKDLPIEIGQKIASDIVNDNKTQLAHFSLQHLPNILSKKANPKITKSEIYRDLFPFFQITHPFKCLSEKDWEKQRGDKVLQSYKRYQRDQIRGLLGIK